MTVTSLMKSRTKSRIEHFTTKEALDCYLTSKRKLGKSIGFVPTMGALHEGHLSLIRASKRENDITVASIFVNAKQFGVDEDFSTYPRQLEVDKQKLIELEVEVLFNPTEAEIYPQGRDDTNHEISVTSPNIVGMYCGKSRPIFFSGVLKIVAILFNLVSPDRAYFGKKDYQQFFLIRKMIEELHFPVEIRGIETERDDNGLALSSRNVYLSNQDKEKASLLYQSLCRIRADRISKGMELDIEAVREIMNETINEQNGFVIDYVEIVDKKNLQMLNKTTKNTIILSAVYFKRVRLLDNIEL